MAVKAVNDLTGPNKIILILLVFSAYPRLTKMDSLSPSIIKRTEAICVIIKEIHYLHIKR